MSKEHQYIASIQWTGNKGAGTSAYKAYERSHSILIDKKPIIKASSDPSFRGDKNLHNPEELFLSSISSCHMLWYLHLCSVNNVIVIEYVDHASGTMKENSDGSGYFTEVLLNPVVTVTESDMITLAEALHHQASKMCYIANSLNFPVKHNPTTKVVALKI